MNSIPWNPVTGMAALSASLPLLNWAWGMIAGNTQRKASDLLSIALIGGSFLLSLWVFIQVADGAVFQSSGSWVQVGTAQSGLELRWGLRIDFLAAAMLAMISGIATLVHFFSGEYLEKDPAFGRYASYLGFFCSAMMWLVLADNLLLIFFCWELVGLASYLLIGFWRTKEAASRASQKAFLVNRIGDAGFLVGILILISFTGTLTLDELPAQLALIPSGWQIAAALCLFVGAAGKSAQFPLQGWLPDAMEGPTPVSSLIHAATMVAAGVYLLARIAFLIPAEAGAVIALVGAITALMGAISAMTQWDIKRVLAYSTISQLGYMVMAIGVGARDMALLHLFTHAFFKCALFLSAGAVIHAVHSQDMREMGGLRKRLPKVFWAYLPPMLALSGLPLFSGFLSKDGILLGATMWAMDGEAIRWLVPIIGFATAGLTAWYMGRHAWLIFFAKASTSGQAIQRPGIRMWLPLALLALLCVWLPFGLHPLTAETSWLVAGWGTSASESSSLHLPLAVLSIFVSLTGLALAYRMRKRFQRTGATEGIFHRLSYRHFFWDWWYEKVIAVAFLRIGHFFQWIDRKLIDGGIHTFAWLVVHPGKTPSLSSMASAIDDRLIDGFVNALAQSVSGLGRRLRRLHTGQVQWSLGMALVMLGVILLLSWLAA